MIAIWHTKRSPEHRFVCKTAIFTWKFTRLVHQSRSWARTSLRRDRHDPTDAQPTPYVNGIATGHRHAAGYRPRSTLGRPGSPNCGVVSYAVPIQVLGAGLFTPVAVPPRCRRDERRPGRQHHIS